MQQLFDFLLKFAVAYGAYRFLDYTLGDREEKRE